MTERGRMRSQIAQSVLRTRIGYLMQVASVRGSETFYGKRDRIVCEFLHALLKSDVHKTLGEILDTTEFPNEPELIIEDERSKARG